MFIGICDYCGRFTDDAVRRQPECWSGLERAGFAFHSAVTAVTMAQRSRDGQRAAESIEGSVTGWSFLHCFCCVYRMNPPSGDQLAPD